MADKKPLSLSGLRQAARIFKFLRPYRVPFTFATLFLLIGSLAGMVIPFMMGKLIDTSTLHKGGFLSDTNSVALALVGIVLVQALVSYFRVSLFATVTEKAMAGVRTHLYDHLMTLSISFFEERRVGEITSRSTNDVDQLQDMLSSTLPDFVRQVVTIIFGITFIFVISPRLTLLALAVIPALVVAAVIYGRFIRRLARERQDALAATSVIIEETLQNIHTVKAFSNEAYESRRYGTSLEKVVHTGIRGAINRGAFATFMVSGLFGAFVLVLWYGATLMKSGGLTAGTLTAFMFYTGFIGGAVAQFGDLFGRLQKTIGASERLFDILAEPGEFGAPENAEAAGVLKAPETPKTPKATEAAVAPNAQGAPKPTPAPVAAYPAKAAATPALHGSVTLEDVRFSYPTRKDIEVLKGISLDIRPGQKVALAGQSGAGKSTIAQLILGFYPPSGGKLLFDGRPAGEYDLRALRSQMAIVPQEVLLFGGSIRENIAYGHPGASEMAIREAARQANALSFIEAFPEGFDTIVGERGVKLSGGQRQRVAIARAILKDPVLLILDEATSALDAQSERLVQDALETLMKNRTTLIIAHRLSTIRHVDTIFVLQEGNIVESGSYDQLEHREGGAFRQLLQLQFRKNLLSLPDNHFDSNV
jgi:ATP-binding cassette subfamily B protein